MDALNERIQSIRIGKNAPEKISAYLKDVANAMKADLSDQEMTKLESILSGVVITKKPRSKKAKKPASDTKSDEGDPPTPKAPKKPRKLTGYGHFMKQTCASLKKEKFSGNYITHVSGLWKALSDIEKKDWNEQAREISLAVTFMSGGVVSVSDNGIHIAPLIRQTAQGLREPIAIEPHAIEPSAVEPPAIEPSAVDPIGSSWGDDSDVDDSDESKSVGSVDSEDY